MDKIYLTSNPEVKWEPTKKGEDEFDFTVFKAIGAGFYVIDVYDEIKFYKLYNRYRKYKVVDKTTNRGSSIEDDCDSSRKIIDHERFEKARVLIKNLQNDFVTNDILLKGNDILIYANIDGNPDKSSKSFSNIEMFTTHKRKEKNPKGFGYEADECNKESGDSRKLGGIDKILVASISMKARCGYVVKGVSADNQCLLVRPQKDLDKIFCAGKSKTSVTEKQYNKWF